MMLSFVRGVMAQVLKQGENNMNIHDVLKMIEVEYKKSNTLYNDKFVSNAEWNGVVREEYTEWEASIHKHKYQYHASKEIVEEAVQIAAMVVKGILSLYKEDEDPLTPFQEFMLNGAEISEGDPVEDKSDGKWFLDKPIPHQPDLQKRGLVHPVDEAEATFKQMYEGDWGIPNEHNRREYKKGK